MRISLNWCQDFSNVDLKRKSTDELVQLATERLGGVESFAKQDNDILIDIENKMFTHRPDCFGILGLARELAGIQDLAFKSPSWYTQTPKFKTVKKLPVKIFNESPKLAPRVMAVVIDSITIKLSPSWMQSYLKRVGIKPINNIVDITNYVMYLTGQPQHAFDYDKLKIHSNGEVNLGPRLARDGEELVLLGKKKVVLSKDDLVLATNQQAVDVAGIMGGLETEVDSNTKTILLTCCSFDMYSVRRTAMKHGLFTEAATRYTKGQTPLQNDRVLAYTMELISKHAGGQQASEVKDNHSKLPKLKSVNVSVDLINSRLGANLTLDEIVTSLSNVEMKVTVESAHLKITPPFWRTDIEIAEDIVEEVGRLHGFNQLPITLPKRDLSPVDPEKHLALKQQVRNILSRAGANELLSYSFVHSDLLKKAGQNPKNAYKLRNALSPELHYYRLSLTPSLLEKVHSNFKAGYKEFAVFEINKTHNKVHSHTKEGVPLELNMLALTYVASQKMKTAQAYFIARRYLDYLASSLGLSLIYKPIEKAPGFDVTQPFDHERSAFVNIKGSDTFLGIVGEYDAEVRRNLKLPERSAGFEIDSLALAEAWSKVTDFEYQPISKYPSSDQDVTLRTKNEVLFAELTGCLEEVLVNSDYIWKLQATGIYQKQASKTKNTTFHLELTHYDHTLTTKEVTNVVKQLVKAAQAAVKAEQV